MRSKLYQHFLKYPKICTDTRKIEPDCIFFALRGPNFNANEFAEEALEKGASLAVVDQEKFKNGDRYMLVDNVLETLQELAKHHRQRLTIPIIGLTGSNGKTTTKELINAVLSQEYNVYATKGNLNNHIGVPLTILSIRPDHEMAIVEMGANHVGEIQQLCEIAQPTHGMITNIGKAHLEGFGGIEGVIRGKSELYHHLIQNEGEVWINSQNEILSNMAKRFSKPMFYPSKEDFYHCKLLHETPYVVIQTEEGETVTTHLVGKYNFENIAAALCIGKYFKVSSQKAHQAIEAYNPSNNRSQVIKKGDNTIILDAYNANPSSMRSALENLWTVSNKHKVVILGDMKELGEDSEEEHQLVGQMLSEHNLSGIYLLGPEMKAAKNKLPQAFHTEDKKELLSELKNQKFKKTAILIKGSRSMALEEVMDVL
ncbi:MAG: UDP-N-acetylmuramoyl-tripeptide--D-alanyl-D-alanine ligase [Fulvivirga sp.]|nr:UDP-N-acetylmuramoyl-tripeptide--D-alanyl-D-alanine ligase [Fulvivirga sp.]